MQRTNENNDGKLCIPALFSTIWKCREHFENKDGIWCILIICNDLELQKKLITRTINGAFWRYLKRFETAEQIMKTRTVNGAFWWYLKRFGTAEKKMTTRTINGAFDGIWNDFETAMRKKYMFWFNQSRSVVGQPSPGNVKIMTLIVAVWRYVMRYFGLQRNFLK